MDRNTTIGYVLILLIFAGYLFLTQRNVKDIEKIKQQKDSVETRAGLFSWPFEEAGDLVNLRYLN